jgi:hypothetical protein
MALHQIDEGGQIGLRGDGICFLGCDVEQRACVTRCGGPHAHASVCCTSSLYLKGTSVYLYHGRAAVCSQSPATSALCSDVLENPVQLGFGTEIHFQSTAVPTPDDTDFRPQGETEPILGGPGVHVLGRLGR